MKRIYSFSEYFKRLDEMRFDEHWLERTESDPNKDRRISRVIPETPANPEGYEIFGFSSGQELRSPSHLTNIDKKIDMGIIKDLITYSLVKMTRSEKLKNWEPSSKAKYVNIFLGRICFILEEGNNPEARYYLVIRGAKPESKHTTGAKGRVWRHYGKGDGVYGFLKHNNLGKTIKYIDKGTVGELTAREGTWDNRTRSEHGEIGKKEFFEKFYSLEYPYGKKFTVKIDLRDKKEDGSLNIELIKKKIDEQFIISQNKLEPEVNQETTVSQEPEVNQETAALDNAQDNRERPVAMPIKPTDLIGLVVKYANPSDPIQGHLVSIQNIQDIELARKSNSLKNIKEIKVQFLPRDPQHWRPKDTKEPIPIRTNITDNTRIQIREVIYKVVQDENGSIISSENPITTDGGISINVVRE